MGTPTRATGITGGIQSNTTDGVTGNLTFTLNTKPATSSDAILVVIYGAKSGTITVSGGGGSWNQIASYNDTGDGCLASAWWKQATASDISGATYTINSSQVNTALRYGAEIITNGTFGVVSNAPTMKSAAFPASGASYNFGSSALAPASPNDLVYALVGNEQTTTSTAITWGTPTNYTAQQTHADTNVGTIYLWSRSKSNDSTSENPAAAPTYTGTAGSATMSVVFTFTAPIVSALPTIDGPQPRNRAHAENAWYAAIPTPQSNATFYPFDVAGPVDPYVRGRYNAEGWFGAFAVPMSPNALAFLPPQMDPYVRGRYHDAWLYVSGVAIVGPSPAPYLPPQIETERFYTGRYHSEGWLAISGVAINGPAPQAFLSAHVMDSYVRGRYHPEGWTAASGVSILGPFPQPLPGPLNDLIRAARLHTNAWEYGSGVSIVGPSPMPYVPPFESFQTNPRRHPDAWYYVSGTRIVGPFPQPVPGVLNDVIKAARYNPEGWTAASGVSINGPTPGVFVLPLETDIKGRGRQHPEGWYVAVGKVTVGPSPTLPPFPPMDPYVRGRYNAEGWVSIGGAHPPQIQSIHITDTGATISDTTQVSLPGAFTGIYFIPFFRPGQW